MPKRPLFFRVWWALRDYAKRVWDNSGEDNVFFLAGGIAFNILLAAVPFFLLLAAGLTYFFDQTPDKSGAEIGTILDRFLPPHPEGSGSTVHAIIDDIVKTRGAVGLYSAIGFIWFSTRLFGSLRTVLAEVFDIPAAGPGSTPAGWAIHRSSARATTPTIATAPPPAPAGASWPSAPALPAASCCT